MVGGSSSSSQSSSSTTNTTEQYDQRVAAADNGVAIGASASVNIQATSPEAFDVAKETVKRTTDFGVSLVDDAFSFGKKSIDLVNQSQSQLIDFVTRRSQSEATTLAQDALKLVMPLAAGAVAVFALKALR